MANVLTISFLYAARATKQQNLLSVVQNLARNVQRQNWMICVSRIKRYGKSRMRLQHGAICFPYLMTCVFILAWMKVKRHEPLLSVMMRLVLRFHLKEKINKKNVGKNASYHVCGIRGGYSSWSNPIAARITGLS